MTAHNLKIADLVDSVGIATGSAEDAAERDMKMMLVGGNGEFVLICGKIESDPTDLLKFVHRPNIHRPFAPVVSGGTTCQLLDATDK